MTAAIRRLPDWRPRLSAYLERVRRRPFAYGTHDCTLFAAGAVEAMTGVDLAVDFRGRYRSLKEGLKLARGSHLDILRRSFAPVDPAFASVGDIALIGEVGYPALGLFEGQHIFVLRDPEGLGLIPRAAATQAWQVA